MAEHHPIPRVFKDSVVFEELSPDIIQPNGESRLFQSFSPNNANAYAPNAIASLAPMRLVAIASLGTGS